MLKTSYHIYLLPNNMLPQSFVLLFLPYFWMNLNFIFYDVVLNQIEDKQIVLYSNNFCFQDLNNLCIFRNFNFFVVLSQHQYIVL
jgi:hypothetical protein